MSCYNRLLPDSERMRRDRLARRFHHGPPSVWPRVLADSLKWLLLLALAVAVWMVWTGGFK